MPKQKHHIRLSAQEREELTSILRKGTASAHRQRHARIFLLADTEDPDGAKSDSQIAAAVQTSGLPQVFDPLAMRVFRGFVGFVGC